MKPSEPKKPSISGVRRGALAAVLVAAVAAVVVWAVRSRSNPPPAPGTSRGANVLLVTIDTLRRDRVGAYAGIGGQTRGRIGGQTPDLTPTLDKLAGRGMRFDAAFSHAPMTLPAHTSILTGLIPRRHGVRNNTGFRLDDRIPTLGTAMKSAGYRTGAFVSAFVLDARFGLSRGFDVYDDHLPRTDRASFHVAERPADDVVQAAGDWILSTPSALSPQPSSPQPSSPQPSSPQPSALSPQPFFVWLHLFDPHTPYGAPPQYRAGRSAYDAEVAYADAALGRLLDRLRAANQLEHTVVIVTADHGESLGDHGETTHGLFAYDTTIRVPLIVAGPGVAPARVVATVGHVDILPTILDLVGLAIPDGLDGRSLVRATTDRPVYFEALDAALTRGWAPLRGVVQDGWKYIDLPEAELYDLDADPAERKNVIGNDPHARTLETALRQFEKSGERTAPAAAVDRDAAARLRALGYVGGSSGPQRTPTLADDPKRLVGLNERFNSALTAFDEGRTDEALGAFTAILAERPDFLSARTSAATALISRGRSAEAAALLRAAPPQQGSSPAVLVKLATALREGGNPAAAVQALEQAQRTGDESLDLLQDLAISYAAAGKAPQALETFHRLAARYPESATGWYNRGLFEMQRRKPDDAAQAFRHAVERDPSYADAWQGLGAVLVAADPAAAIDAWRHAERLVPHDYDLLYNLGMLSAERGQTAEAIPYLQRFAAEAPRDRYAADIERVRQTLARLAGQPR